MATFDAQYKQMDTWKEILSQPDVWQVVLPELEHDPVVQQIISKAKVTREWLFIGCGTSYYLAEAAAHSWSALTGQPARALPASEVLLYPKLLSPGAPEKQAVVISRSGKTSETVRAAKVLSQDLGIPVIGITCAEQSELQLACGQSIVLLAADEKSTVMTRSFSSMLIALQYLAARLAGNSSFLQALDRAAKSLGSRITGIAEAMEYFVQKHAVDDYIFLGQGAFHGIAREAALKVMEMSCSYSQFFHTLEFRHGPKAIVSPATCLTFFLSKTGYEAEMEVLEEMKELGGVILTICQTASASLKRSSDLVIELPAEGDELASLASSIVPAQLFGFFCGIRKNLTPDQPKNLTRVVILD
jgi:glucosamine--fructose-6-phosphate aminotransferase (isomerizing)